MNICQSPDANKNDYWLVTFAVVKCFPVEVFFLYCRANDNVHTLHSKERHELATPLF